MFGSIGGGEILVLLVLGLLLFGPRRLPGIGRMLGKAISEFRSASTDFRMNLEREVRLDEVRSAGRDLDEAASDLKGVARDPLGTGEPATPERAATAEPGRDG